MSYRPQDDGKLLFSGPDGIYGTVGEKKYRHDFRNLASTLYRYCDIPTANICIAS